MGYLVIEPKESCKLFFKRIFSLLANFKTYMDRNLVRRFFISNGVTEQRLKICQQTGYSIISDKPLVVSFLNSNEIKDSL